MSETGDTKLSAIGHLMQALKGVSKRSTRRAILADRFTAILARKPLGEASLGPLGVAWRRQMAAWQAHYQEARAGSYRDPAKAARKESVRRRREFRHELAKARRKWERKEAKALTRVAEQVRDMGRTV